MTVAYKSHDYDTLAKDTVLDVECINYVITIYTAKEKAGHAGVCHQEEENLIMHAQQSIHYNYFNYKLYTYKVLL